MRDRGLLVERRKGHFLFAPLKPSFELFKGNEIKAYEANTVGSGEIPSLG